MEESHAPHIDCRNCCGDIVLRWRFGRGAARCGSSMTSHLAHAKYIDLTHTITPAIPVWHGFGPSKFAPTLNPETGKPYTYKDDGFEATHYDLSTDQLGTQLDPPAHWAPEYPAIDELPADLYVAPARRHLDRRSGAKDPGYALQVSDIHALEKRTWQRFPQARSCSCARIGRSAGRTPGSPAKRCFPASRLGCAQVPASSAPHPDARP